MPDARVDNSVRSRALEVPRERLRCGIGVGIERLNRLACQRTKIMQFCIDGHDDFPELRSPARCLPSPCHEAGMVVDRLEQRGLEPVPNIEHAVAAIGKPAWPVGADMGEWRHEVGGPVTADAAIDRNEVEIANRRHDAGIGLLLCRDQ